MRYPILYLLLALLLATGCSKKLDIKPTQSISEDQVFTNDANIKAALNGAYDKISSGSLLGGDLQLFAELLAADGEIRWAGTYNQPEEVYNKAILTNNSYVFSTWSTAYSAINICNNIISAINVVNADDRDRIRGEALFLRGLMYFELVKLFGQPYSAGNTTSNLGVPLIITPTIGNISDANRVPRNTVEEVYTQVLDDLTDAKTLLPEENGVYATTYMAAAVLSRVYLQMANYVGARDEANYVIESGYYDMPSTYAASFNNTANSSGDILAMQVTAQDGDNDMHLFWSIPDYGARDGDVDVLQKHINLYEVGDARLALFYIDDLDIYRSGKWKLQYRNIPCIRLAEMYLTRAESNFRLSTNVGNTPDADINDVIRAKAGLGSITITLNAILLERHKELAHEGQRIHDVKRLKQSVDGFAYNDNKLVFPIPIREINAVGGGVLQQNPGYQ